MKQYKKPYELKNLAKDKLQGKFGSAMLVLLMYGLITGSVSMLVSSISSTTTATVYAMTDSVPAAVVITVI